MKNYNTLQIGALALALVLPWGCSSKSASSESATANSPAANLAAAQPNAQSDSGSYPSWAAAVVPDYPHVKSQSLVPGGLFQIETNDDPAAVFAWYKARVPGTWGSNDPESPGNASEWSNDNARGIAIEIQKSVLSGYGKTMIALRPKK